MKIKQTIQFKNIGDPKFPRIVIGEFAVYMIDGNKLIPSQTHHGILRGLTATKPEFSRNAKQSDKFKDEIKLRHDEVNIWAESVIYEPHQGSVGSFYIFYHATQKSVVFKFWKENK